MISCKLEILMNQLNKNFEHLLVDIFNISF